ncbi:glycoside hydrolase [Cytophagaceae bacterium DM2B3-1]|uniref:Glycoside hydrolase n=1 Tax=Xanthocytophaga flava TaxID=3048013 RepID=A0ABT7CH20_9BACT|nr:glycoside hydrolase [Xanthocytophaga flavus]MDJ1472338.1 glycoside hydrolase [Xanthocytophaga flavus]MDJ1493035.1 glycoside hydrolase [Xanthocytophaga flavus]
MNISLLSLKKTPQWTLISLFSFTLFLASCSIHNQKQPQTSSIKNSVIIHLDQRQQYIRNFGASDAWTCQFIGNWPQAKKEQVADWLFSMENDANGKPKGIGLSCWRFNIGAGSATQNNISDEWRQTEGFLKADMSYDWSKQSGQRWFMQAAKQRGVEQFIGFTNSPPIQLTKNGKAFSSNGEQANIAPEKYLAFAKFLADVSRQFSSDGLPFTYLSPFNEPQWDWTGNGQEGTPYTNTEITAITKILDSVLTTQNLSVKIKLAEAAKLNYLYEKADKPTRGEQIYTFFNNQSPLYVGNLSHVDKVISGHSYFTSAPAETLKSVRQKVAAAFPTASVPLEFWQSEYCLLGDQEEVTPSGKDTGMTPALYVARLIHHDLAIANASAWHWWLAVTAYDYKDGLIYATKNKTDGQVEETRLMWALGNFSRFIRPGSQRVTVTSDNRDVNNVNGVMISSYVSADEKQLITVLVNNSNSDANILPQTEGGSVQKWKPYLTGSGTDETLKPLATITAGQAITIPKKSIVTLIGDM